MRIRTMSSPFTTKRHNSARSCGRPAAARSTADTEPAHCMQGAPGLPPGGPIDVRAHPQAEGAPGALWE